MRMLEKIALLPLVMAISFGCHGPNKAAHAVSALITPAPALAAANAARPSAFIRLFPDDGATNTGLSNPGAVVQPGPLGASTVIEELLKTMRLETWPEGVKVAAHAAAPTGPSVGGQTLELVSDQPLEDRWYIMRVGPLSDAAAWPLYRHFQLLPDGTAQLRFAPHSAPAVLRVELCDKGSEITGAVIYSQRVKLVGRPEAALEVLGRSGSDCQVVGASNLLERGTPRTTEIDVVRFRCASDARSSISLRTKPGITDRGGRPPQDFSKTMRWTELEDAGEGCVVSRN